MTFITILFTDDTELIRKLVCPFLRVHGYEVIEAAYGTEAIAAAAQYPRPIDLLISDVVMPGLDGPTLARRLAYRDPDCELWPGVAFLPKAFAPSSMVGKAAEVLGVSAIVVGSEAWRSFIDGDRGAVASRPARNNLSRRNAPSRSCRAECGLPHGRRW
jgi:CheY-like chemotaxis protein